MARLVLPRSLRDAAAVGGELPIEAGCAVLADVFAQLAREHPLIERRLRDETGAIRRYVNVYVDGEDVRSLTGLQTPIGENATVQVIQSVAGG